MHLTLPDGFATPPLLKRDNPEINAAVLAMGTACYEAGYNSIVVKENLAARTREAEMATQIAELKELVKISDETRRNALEEQEERIRARYERAIEIASTERESAEEKIAALRQQLEEIQDSAAELKHAAIDEALQRERSRTESTIAVYKERIIKAEQALEAATRSATAERTGFMKSIGELRDTIHASEKTKLTTQQNSSRKGAAAEDQLADLIRAAVSGYDSVMVEKMSTEPESGDIHVTFNDLVPPFRVLVDSKAYTRNVDHAERDKIRHDMETWSGVSAGILVSMHTGIVGVVDGFIEFTPSGKPLMNLCRLATFTPDQQVRTLALAFAVLRNHATWGASQRILANAHMHVQYYRRTMEQLQNQITAAEKHALVTLRDICGLQNSVTQMRIELMETLAGETVERTLCVDAIRTWWNETFEIGEGEIGLIDAYSEWRETADVVLRNSITKDAFVSLVCGAIGIEPDITIKSGPGGSKRIAELATVQGWVVRGTAVPIPQKHYKLVCVDSHTEMADIRKTIMGLRGILRSKAAGGCSFNWRIEDNIHTIYMSGNVDVKGLPLKTTRTWAGELTVEDVDENPWAGQDWTPGPQIAAAAPAKMTWNN